jgi:hypothetical protein
MCSGERSFLMYIVVCSRMTRLAGQAHKNQCKKKPLRQLQRRHCGKNQSWKLNGNQTGEEKRYFNYRQAGMRLLLDEFVMKVKEVIALLRYCLST